MKKQHVIGILLGIVVYTLYVMFFRHNSGMIHLGTKEDVLKPFSSDIAPEKACIQLAHTYHLDLSNKESIVLSSLPPSARFHWLSFQCGILDYSNFLKKHNSHTVIPETKETPILSPKSQAASHREDPFAAYPHSVDSSKDVDSSPKSIEDQSDQIKCEAMKSKFGVLPGSSWGNLPTELQKEWNMMNCDGKVTAIVENPQSFVDEINVPSDTIESSGKSRKGKKDKNKKHEIERQKIGLPSIKEENSDWCVEMRSKYGVIPMKSWGRLPMNMMEEWKFRQCDIVFTSQRMIKRSLSNCLATSVEKTNPSKQQLRRLSTVEIMGDMVTLYPKMSKNSSTTPSHPNLRADLPLIAIMAATTTRKVKNPSPKNMALFTILLPSLIRTLDCGFRYEYVLGYDIGDPFYDTSEGMATTKKWFSENVEKPMKDNAISIVLRPVKVNNNLKKPGPVFLEMARAAYNDGAQYFYRINDDTELVDPWPQAFVNALLDLKEPYGVVGPDCKQGNQKILTHDFVHRLHMDIFEMNYYPPQLTDWWMDDWISFVYGKKRTYKARKHTAIHHTGAHGQRYEVDKTHEKLLGSLVKSGKQKIRQWMLTHNVDESVIRVFDKDDFSLEFAHNNIPERLEPK